MLAWKKHGKGETPETASVKGDKLVGKYYVMFDEHLRAQMKKLMGEGMSEEEAKKKAPLTQMVQDMLVNWENGDPETVALWQMMNGWVYDGFDMTYDRMGVEFDQLYYESETYKKGKQIVLDGIDKGLFFKKEDGSVWVDLEPDGLDQKLLMRGDGTTVYMTQDIGTAVQRAEDFPDLKQVVYTVGDEQDYHFKVLFLILEKLGYDWAPACRHLSYGMVDLPSGKMKSREGTVVDADDLMDEVIAAARASSQEKGKLEEMDADEQLALFEMLGIGALKFFLLRVDPRKRMMFDPEESVSLNGDTGPFVQYTHARCKAVLRKAGTFTYEAPKTLIDKERMLIRSLLDFRAVAHHAASDMNPASIANYAIDVAKLYNQFYHDAPILKAEGAIRGFRLALTELTASTLKQAMALLGIAVPERM
jgi:arginyl-tRNA synthetase